LVAALVSREVSDPFFYLALLSADWQNQAVELAIALRNNLHS
jgi:hypothetical protein